MPETLIFLMGKYEAHFPTDRRYTRNHLWLQEEGESFKVGFTAYSVKLLNDVYFLDWTIDPDTQVRHKQTLGEIESSKALSSLYAPADGRVLEFNEQVLGDPSLINTDAYGAGWLYRFQSDSDFLTPEDYLKFLDDNWEETQRLLKGQLN